MHGWRECQSGEGNYHEDRYGIGGICKVGLLSSLYHYLLVSIFITFGSIGVFSVIPYGMTLNCNVVKGNKTRS